MRPRSAVGVDGALDILFVLYCIRFDDRSTAYQRSLRSPTSRRTLNITFGLNELGGDRSRTRARTCNVDVSRTLSILLADVCQLRHPQQTTATEITDRNIMELTLEGLGTPHSTAVAKRVKLPAVFWTKIKFRRRRRVSVENDDEDDECSTCGEPCAVAAAAFPRSSSWVDLTSPATAISRHPASPSSPRPPGRTCLQHVNARTAAHLQLP